MTLLEQYEADLKALEERFKEQKRILQAELESNQWKCRHLNLKRSIMKQTVRVKANPEVKKFLAQATQVVSEMPDWERGVLQASSQPSNEQSRVPTETRFDEGADGPSSS